MKSPRLSILLMSFNRPRGLQLAIESVIAQTYTDWELIVCDDQSPDPAVVETFKRLSVQHEDRAISWIVNEPEYAAGHRQRVNTLGANLNRGIRFASGDFVSYIGDGVTYVPDRCERAIEYLAANSKTAIMWGHQVNESYRDGQLMARTERRCGGPPQIYPGSTMASRLVDANVCDHCSVVERIGVARLFPWSEDPKYWRTPDWERWRRIAGAGKRFDFVPEIGEVKRMSNCNLGAMLRRGASIEAVVERRKKGEDHG